MVASTADKIVAGMAANESKKTKSNLPPKKVRQATYKHDLTIVRRNCSLRNCTVCVHVTWLSSISCRIVYWRRRSRSKAVFIRNLHRWCNWKPVHGFSFYASLNGFSLKLKKFDFCFINSIGSTNCVWLGRDTYLKFFDLFA